MRVPGVACFLFVLMAVLPVLSLAEPAPSLSIEQTEYHFGEIFQGESVSHVFTFSNDGDAPLVIDRVKSSCGCTAALLSSKNIPPGGQGTIRATFDSSRFRDSVHKVIMLYSNAPGKGRVQFSIKGVVKPVVESTPRQVEFGEVNVGSSKQLSVELVNAWDEDLEILNVRTSNTAVKVETDAEVLVPGVPARFTLTAAPLEDSPHLRGYLLVRTDHKLGEIRVPIHGFIMRPPQ